VARILPDDEIATILSEPKRIGPRQFEKLREAAISDPVSGKEEAFIDFKTKHRRPLRIRVSRQKRDVACRCGSKCCKFSIIFAWLSREGERIPIRCNGHGPAHTNTIEKRTKSGIAKIPENTCHVHMLTERYQHAEKGEHYAEPTNEYNSALSALEYLCNRFFIATQRGYKKYQPLLE
jgi:hypothetical protein